MTILLSITPDLNLFTLKPMFKVQITRRNRVFIRDQIAAFITPMAFKILLRIRNTSSSWQRAIRIICEGTKGYDWELSKTCYSNRQGAMTIWWSIKWLFPSSMKIVKYFGRKFFYSLNEHIYASCFHGSADSLPRSDHRVFLSGGERETGIGGCRCRRFIHVTLDLFFTVATTRQFAQFTSHCDTSLFLPLKRFNDLFYQRQILMLSRFLPSSNLFTAVAKINLKWHFRRQAPTLGSLRRFQFFLLSIPLAFFFQQSSLYQDHLSVVAF